MEDLKLNSSFDPGFGYRSFCALMLLSLIWFVHRDGAFEGLILPWLPTGCGALKLIAKKWIGEDSEGFLFSPKNSLNAYPLYMNPQPPCKGNWDTTFQQLSLSCWVMKINVGYYDLRHLSVVVGGSGKTRRPGDVSVGWKPCSNRHPGPFDLSSTWLCNQISSKRVINGGTRLWHWITSVVSANSVIRQVVGCHRSHHNWQTVLFH